MLLSVQRHSGGETIIHDDIKADVAGVVRTLGSESVGNITEAGKITGVSLIGIERSDGSVWDGPVTYGASGHALYPATVQVEVQVEYSYEPVEVVDGD